MNSLKIIAVSMLVPWAVSTISILTVHQAQAQSMPTSNTSLIWDYVNTDAFREGAKQFYLKEVASNAQRAKIISTAEEECGGRYKGTAINLTQLDYHIEAERPVKGDEEHTNKSTASTVARWLLVETISCSFTRGYSQTVLHAVLITGHENLEAIYRDRDEPAKALSPPLRTNLKHTYSIDSDLLQDQYKTPYE
jgi:hypothetical protein